MTLKEFIIEVKNNYPSVEKEKVVKAVCQLEDKILGEIFSPSGVKNEVDISVDADIDRPLILSNYDRLYTSYITSILALEDGDFEVANAHTAAFNLLFSQLAAEYRRKFIPIKNTPISGGVFN